MVSSAAEHTRSDKLCNVLTWTQWSHQAFRATYFISAWFDWILLGFCGNQEESGALFPNFCSLSVLWSTYSMTESTLFSMATFFFILFSSIPGVFLLLWLYTAFSPRNYLFVYSLDKCLHFCAPKFLTWAHPFKPKHGALLLTQSLSRLFLMPRL